MLRQPVVEPVHNTRDISDIATELADRIGILSEYNKAVNESLGLTPPYQLEPDKKYDWTDIVNRQCLSATGGAHDLEWFKEHCVLEEPLPVEGQYDVHLQMKAKNLRYPIPYFEQAKRAGEELARNLTSVGIDWWPTGEYVPLPIYLPSILDQVPPEYDFYVTFTRLVQFSTGLDVDVPWLLELTDQFPGKAEILMHAEAARGRGINEGDEVWLESEVGRVRGRVKLSQGLRPDTVVIPGQFGYWSTPVAKDKGWVSLTALLPIRYSWTDPVCGTMQGSVVKAKIYKAR
jgi:phenylacetyl-CoA:acceptor oxidoreductase